MIRSLAVALLVAQTFAAEPLTVDALRAHLASPRPLERVCALAWAADLADQALVEASLTAMANKPLIESGEYTELRRLADLLETAALARIARDSAEPLGSLLIRRLAVRGPETCLAIANTWKTNGKVARSNALTIAALSAAKPGAAGIDALTTLALGTAGGKMETTVRQLPSTSLSSGLLCGLLAHPDPNVHAAAVEALSRLSADNWDQALVERALADTEAKARLAGILQAGNLCALSAEAWPLDIVVRCLGSTDSAVRRTAFTSLISCKKGAVDPALIIAGLADPEKSVRASAGLTAYYRQVKLSEDLTLSLLNDADDRVCQVGLLLAHGYKGSHAIALRVEELAPTQRGCLHVLRDIDAPHAVEVAARFARDQKAVPWLRMQALDVLEAEHDPRLGELATLAISADDPALRLLARQHLASVSGVDQASIAAAGLARRIGIDIDFAAVLALEPEQRIAKLAEIYGKLKPPARSELQAALRERKDNAFEDVMALLTIGSDKILAREAAAALASENDCYAAAIPALALLDGRDPEMVEWAKRNLARLSYSSLFGKSPLTSPGMTGAPAADATAETILAWLKQLPINDPSTAERQASGFLSHPDRRVRFETRRRLLTLLSANPQALDLQIANYLEAKLFGIGNPDYIILSRCPQALLERIGAFSGAAPKQHLDALRQALETAVSKQKNAVDASNVANAQAKARQSDEERMRYRESLEHQATAATGAGEAPHGTTVPVAADRVLPADAWRPGQLRNTPMTIQAGTDGAMMSFAIDPTKDKASAEIHFPARNVSTVELDVDVLEGGETKIAVMIYAIPAEADQTVTGEVLLFYESAVQVAGPGRKTLSFPLKGQWKSSKKQWQFAEVDFTNLYTNEITLYVYHEGHPSRLLVRSTTLKSKP